ncbi:hypothetical protein FRC02_009582 [Tulasnella sp. 418]|nr:hypothetical protein FRC02_009582 [Tulasnella sp. 418]
MGCGQYPAYDDFLERLKIEAEQAVVRLRHHPSLVIFAGNNEDYQVAEALKLELDYSDEDPSSDFRKTNFPARHIYERVLPEIVDRLSDVFYHRGSPYSGYGKASGDKQWGDLHQWNVWHGTQEPWHNWDILAGRFVSEFGMEGYPDIRTVDFWLGDNNAERHPQSRIMNNHNKADGFERRLELYLVENFKHAFDIESYVYYTQVMQAETLASAYRLWRQHPNSVVYFTIDTILEIWATNSTLVEKKATLDVTVFDLAVPDVKTEDDVKAKSVVYHRQEQVILQPNSSTELFKGSMVPLGQPIRTKLSEVPKTLIVSTRLLDQDGTVLSRYANWPEPFKFINFPEPDALGFKVTTSDDGESVTLSTLRPMKGIVLDAEGEHVKWSDQAIDLVPGDPQTIRAVGLKGRKVKARYLGDGSA